ncbi:vacuolar protein sorting/secretion protein, putative [Theileria annulata]|uniref:Vacuolar protein sorting/secretion protein, putative n=1 Tax=Theileria annulata TaxID=5874 RepID=Q4U948_THEAN|nr:vacuolar protein sorting/secretion protein, putative [Theileria annulata]CAI76655.1 vacuolar protein sorting/secretion protein, putative [Theileria annulata]|eukprot:XP_953280.1 vacuolar protein sorting/secretion protein, putative [Theileria annulata]
MILLEQVSLDSKNNFYRTFIDIIASINKYEEYKNSRTSTVTFKSENPTHSNEISPSNSLNEYDPINGDKKQDDSITLSISENNITLICSDDVYDMLNVLFNDSILELGFLSFNRIEDGIARQSKGIAEDYNVSKVNEVFVIRPTFRDSQRLATLLQTRHTNVIRVVCLPEICELYPEVLSNLLGKNYTVCKYGSNTPYTNNLVELFECPIHMVPVDGILSMFMPNSFSDFYLNGDPTTAWFFAKALDYLQRRHLGGSILNVTGVGTLSKYVIELMLKNRRDLAANMIVEGMDKIQNEKCFIPIKLLQYYHDNMLTDVSNFNIYESKKVNKLNDLDSRILLTNSASFKSSIIIDRKVDLITPMCTNFTYEGLLDSVFGLKCNTVNVDSQALDGKLVSSLDLVVDFQKSKQKNNFNKKPVSLKSKLYEEIRWLDFSKVGSYLHEKALRVKKGYEGGGMQTIGEMGEFVKKFKSLQQEHVTLSTHVNIMGYLNSFVKSERFHLVQNIEDCILQGSTDGNKDDSKLANISKLWTKKSGDPFIAQILELIFWNIQVFTIFRLLILLSQTMDGLKQSDFDTIKKAIIYQYGFQYLKTIQNFIKSGLIKINNVVDSSRWQKIYGKFNLLVDSELSKSDCSGIFGGYAPLSIRIVQLLSVSNDSAPLSSEFGLLNCQIVSTKQKPVTSNSHSNLNRLSKDSRKSSLNDSLSSEYIDDPTEHCLICYIGGITIGEVASVSLINSFNKSKFVVLTTDIVNSIKLTNM